MDGAAAQRAPIFRLFFSSPTPVVVLLLPPLLRHPRRRLALSATCSASAASSLVLGNPRRQPLLEAVQSLPAPLAAEAVRRDAGTGLALLLFVLAVVMSSFLSLIVFSFAAHRALQQLETKAQKLSKLVLEEVPGTLSSLKLSFMEINDFTSQLKSLRVVLGIWQKHQNSNPVVSPQQVDKDQVDVLLYTGVGRLASTVTLAVDTRSLHSDVEGSISHIWTSQTCHSWKKKIIKILTSS